MPIYLSLSGYLVAKRGKGLYLNGQGEEVRGRDDATRFPTLARAEQAARDAGPGWRVIPLGKPSPPESP